MHKIRRIFSLFLTITLCSHHSAANESESPLTIFAASSLTGVLQQLSHEWAENLSKKTPRLSFAASAIMARQISAGAPAHIFISANPDWIIFLEQASLTEGTAILLVKNALVYATPINWPDIMPGEHSAAHFLSYIGQNKLVLADPAIAPAGHYAKKYLQKLGVWEQLLPQVAYGSNVRQTLLLIERGNLSGFVYKSDIMQSKLAKTGFIVPEALSGAILYKATKLITPHPDAKSFLKYITSPESAHIWQQTGFVKTVP